MAKIDSSTNFAQLLRWQAARIEQQAPRFEARAARIAELELALTKAKKDSSTSSKPPSSDLTRPKAKKCSGRRKNPRRGGQPGHEKQLRELLSPERVDEASDYEIDDDEVRWLGLTPTGDVEVFQPIELPEAPVHVTEYRLAVYQDADGPLYIPDCPEAKGPLFGPPLLATIGWLKSMGHCSYSTIETWREDVLRVPVSGGYLAKPCTGTISASLADAYDELREAVPRPEQLGRDETRIKDNGKKCWIGCITAATFSLFHIAASRSRDILEKWVGPEFAGYLNLDYFSASLGARNRTQAVMSQVLSIRKQKKSADVGTAAEPRTRDGKTARLHNARTPK